MSPRPLLLLAALPLLLLPPLQTVRAQGAAPHDAARNPAHGPGHDPATMHGAPAPAAASPYAGQETRAIKALAPQEVRDLRAGAGMGLAKAAELNHYPGPRHVLELAEPLTLSEKQRAATEAIFAAMQARAIALGEALLAEEQALDAAFASGAIDTATLRTHTAEIGRLQGELRAVHLAAHLEVKVLLSPAQVSAYDRLRGYTGGAPGRHAGGGADHARH